MCFTTRSRCSADRAALNQNHDDRGTGEFPASMYRLIALHKLVMIDTDRRSRWRQAMDGAVDSIGKHEVSTDIESVAAIVAEYRDLGRAVMAMAHDIEITNRPVVQGRDGVDVAGKLRLCKTTTQLVDLPVAVRERHTLARQQDQDPVAVVEARKRAIAIDAGNTQSPRKRLGPGYWFRQQQQRLAAAVAPWDFLVTFWLMNLQITHSASLDCRTPNCRRLAPVARNAGSSKMLSPELTGTQQP